MPATSSDLASLVADLQNRTTNHPSGVGTLLDLLRRTARRLAPRDFEPRGLIDDVVSRALELTCRRRSGHFDPERGSVEGYLISIVRTAIRDVRDENQITIGRRRDYQVREDSVPRRPVAEPICDLGSNVSLVTELAHRLDRHPELMVGAVAIAFYGHTVVDAAAAAGITRFRLTRQLARELEREHLAA